MTIEGIFGLIEACGSDVQYCYGENDGYYTFYVRIFDMYADGNERELEDTELVNNIKIILENTCKEKTNDDFFGEVFIFENFKIIWRLQSEDPNLP